MAATPREIYLRQNEGNLHIKTSYLQAEEAYDKRINKRTDL